jgi:hypothetical protein
LAATREFVESEDIFDYLEKQLGGLFNGGRPPPAGRSNWVCAFDPEPHSWYEYERRVLRLVEWTLLYNARGKLVQMREEDLEAAEALAAEAAAALEAAVAVMEPLPATENKKSKRHARKRAAAAQARHQRSQSKDEPEHEDAEAQNTGFWIRPAMSTCRSIEALKTQRMAKRTTRSMITQTRI